MRHVPRKWAGRPMSFNAIRNLSLHSKVTVVGTKVGTTFNFINAHKVLNVNGHAILSNQVYPPTPLHIDQLLTSTEHDSYIKDNQANHSYLKVGLKPAHNPLMQVTFEV